MREKLDFIFKLPRVLNAVFLFVVYKLGLYDDADTAVIKQREAACEKCPLRSGNWCSSKKFIDVKLNRPKNGPFFRERYKRVTGCSCYLPFKYHDRKEPQIEICPRKIWKFFKK